MAVPAQANQRAYLSGATGGDTLIPYFNLRDDGGLVVPTPGTPPSVGDPGGSRGLAISPGATKLLAGGNIGLAANFSITPATGVVTGGPGANNLLTGAAPYGFVITPDGRFAFQALEGPEKIEQLTIPANGQTTFNLPVSVTVSGTDPRGLAITPDGRYLYAAKGDGTISGYSIGATGLLTSLGAPVPAAASPYAISITPDGRHLYVPSRFFPGAAAYGFDINADGSLTAIAGSPFSLDLANDPQNTTISPDGRFYFTSNYQGGDVSVFAIAASGALSEVAGSPFPVGGAPSGITTDADGTHLYVGDALSTNLDVLAVSGAGALAAVPGSPFPVGVVAGYQSVALAPDQPPVAALTVRQRGRSVTLDATASTDADGTIARYDWDFGDGATASTPSPTVTHEYAKGSFTPSVTETDDQGCSVSYVAAGQTAFCNGSGVARVAGAALSTVAPELKVSAKKGQRLGKPLKLKLSSDAGVDYDVAAKAKLKGAAKGSVKFKGGAGSLAAGVRQTVKLKLSGKAAKLARSARKGRASVIVTVADAVGNETTKTVKVKLK